MAKGSRKYDEVVLLTNDQAGDLYVQAYLDQEQAWYPPEDASFIRNMNYTGVSVSRPYDMVVEGLSQDHLIVYRHDNLHDAVYKTYDGITLSWDHMLDLNHNVNTLERVTLTADPNSDRALLMTKKIDGETHVLRTALWDGDNWLWTERLTENCAVGRDNFDAAYESDSGDLMFIWPPGGPELKYRLF